MVETINCRISFCAAESPSELCFFILRKSSAAPMRPKPISAESAIQQYLLVISIHNTTDIKTDNIIKRPPIVGVPVFVK